SNNRSTDLESDWTRMFDSIFTRPRILHGRVKAVDTREPRLHFARPMDSMGNDQFQGLMSEGTGHEEYFRVRGAAGAVAAGPLHPSACDGEQHPHRAAPHCQWTR